MTVDQKDVITNLLGAAGGAAGFGVALVGAVIALHGLRDNPDKNRLNRWMKEAALAFVLALGSVGIGFLWLVVSAWSADWPGLGALYVVAVGLFLLAIGILVYVLARVIWVLRKADLFAIASEAATRLKQFLAAR